MLSDWQNPNQWTSVIFLLFLITLQYVMARRKCASNTAWTCWLSPDWGTVNNLKYIALVARLVIIANTCYIQMKKVIKLLCLLVCLHLLTCPLKSMYNGISPGQGPLDFLFSSHVWLSLSFSESCSFRLSMAPASRPLTTCLLPIIQRAF